MRNWSGYTGQRSQSFGAILAHLITKRQILSLAEVQALAGYFVSPVRGLASHLGPVGPGPEPLPPQAAPREVIDLEQQSALDNQAVSMDETHLVMTELLSWGTERKDQDPQAK